MFWHCVTPPLKNPGYAPGVDITFEYSRSLSFVIFFCPVDAENVQRELEMLSQSAASGDSKPNSLVQARGPGVNSDLHSASHSQSNGLHSSPNTTKNIANGLPSKTSLQHFLLTHKLKQSSKFSIAYCQAVSL